MSVRRCSNAAMQQFQTTMPTMVNESEGGATVMGCGCDGEGVQGVSHVRD